MLKGRRPFTDKTLLIKDSLTHVFLLSGETTLREQKHSIGETLSETLASVPTDAKLHTDIGATRKGTNETYLERPQGESRTVCTSSSFRSFFLHLKQICLHLTFTHEEMHSAAPRGLCLSSGPHLHIQSCAKCHALSLSQHVRCTPSHTCFQTGRSSTDARTVLGVHVFLC